MKRIIVGVATACLSMAAWAQEPSPQQMKNPPAQGEAQVTSMTTTVDKVDLKKREVTIKTADGSPVMIQVPENVQNLQNLKPGDKVQIDYYQSVALSLQKKPGTLPMEARTFTAKPSTSGNMPGGTMAQEIDATANVKKVDMSKGTVTIEGPEGKMDTITVKDPQLKQELSKVKPGDAINVTYTEAMAISAMKKGGTP
jgi:Cu/Ag efflux protein CusF